MRDEPTGRYVVRQTGKPVTAKRFHLYRDCGLIADMKPPQYDVIDLGLDPDDQMAARTMDMMGLSACQPCENRSKEVSALDCVADSLSKLLSAAGLVEILRIPQENISPEVDHMLKRLFADDGVVSQIACHVTADLERAGYAIRRVKAGGPS